MALSLLAAPPYPSTYPIQPFTREMALHSLSKLLTTTFALIPRIEPDSTTRPNNLQSPWLSANNLSLPPSSLRIRTQEPKLHRFSATVCLNLSTVNAEIVSSIEKVPKWMQVVLVGYKVIFHG